MELLEEGKIHPTDFKVNEYERIFMVGNRVCVQKDYTYLVDATRVEVEEFLKIIKGAL